MGPIPPLVLFSPCDPPPIFPRALKRLQFSPFPESPLLMEFLPHSRRHTCFTKSVFHAISSSFFSLFQPLSSCNCAGILASFRWRGALVATRSSSSFFLVRRNRRPSHSRGLINGLISSLRLEGYSVPPPGNSSCPLSSNRSSLTVNSFYRHSVSPRILD